MEKSPVNFSMFGFVALVGAGFGIAYGFVRSAHLSKPSLIACVVVILLIQWLIFRSGASSSYANAQAWASAQVDVAVSVSNEARAQAIAQVEVATQAIANAQSLAIATNTTIVQLAQLSSPELAWEGLRKLAGIDDEVLLEKLAVGSGLAPSDPVGVRGAELL